MSDRRLGKDKRSEIIHGVTRSEWARQIGHLGGRVRSAKKAIAMAKNARKGRDAQRAKNGGLFGGNRFRPVVRAEGQPTADRWGRLDGFRDGVTD